MTDLPEAVHQRRFEADFPWCRTCKTWRAEAAVSTRCPVCDPDPYKTRTERDMARAVDAERRSSAQIVDRARQLAAQREAS